MNVDVGPTVGIGVSVGGGPWVGGRKVAVIRIGIGVNGGNGFSGVFGFTKMMLNTMISKIEATKNRIATRFGKKVLRGLTSGVVGTPCAVSRFDFYSSATGGKRSAGGDSTTGGS